jgi:hypothetical protein
MESRDTRGCAIGTAGLSADGFRSAIPAWRGVMLYARSLIGLLLTVPWTRATNSQLSRQPGKTRVRAL